jgi:hypothetical protein
MKKSLLFLLLLSFTFLKSQSISINWDGVKDIPINENVQKKMPHFKNEGYSLINNLPYFSYSREVSGKGIVTISNIQYAPVSNAEKGEMNTAEIPSKLEYLAKVNQAGNQYFVSVGMNPFVKENNQIKKVTHFE